MYIKTKVTAVVLMSAGERIPVIVSFGERIPQRDIVKQAQSSLEAQYEKKEAIYLEQKQSTDTHPEKSAGVLNEESGFKSLIRDSSSRSLFSSGQLSPFFSHI